MPRKLSNKDSALFLKQCPGWKINKGKLCREWKFKDYKETFRAVSKIASLAEREGHHPDIFFTWGKLSVELYTHAIKGLSEKDFSLAVKIDRVL